jgi:drug/metabolite transporter (DMT)-like permease
MSVPSLIRLIFLGAIWGASFLFTRVVSPEFGAFTTACLRLGIGGVFLALVYKGSAALFKKEENLGLSKHWRTYLGIGIINSAIPFTLFAYAALTTPASYLSILNSTAPLWGTLFTVLIARERVSRSQVLGLILGLTGVTVLTYHPDQTSSDHVPLLGLLAGFAAAGFYGLNGVVVKLKGLKLPTKGLATWSQLMASLSLLLPALLFNSAEPALITTEVWLSLAALGALCSGVAYMLYFKLAQDEGPVRSLTVTFLIPVFGILWSKIFLNETITAQMIGGGCLILCGMALTLRKKS